MLNFFFKLKYYYDILSYSYNDKVQLRDRFRLLAKIIRNEGTLYCCLSRTGWMFQCSFIWHKNEVLDARADVNPAWKRRISIRIIVPLLAFWHAFAFRFSNSRVNYSYVVLWFSLFAYAFYAFISRTNAFAHYTCLSWLEYSLNALSFFAEYILIPAIILKGDIISSKLLQLDVN